MLITASPLTGLPVRVELRAAEFDLAAAVQEDAEDNADGIGISCRSITAPDWDVLRGGRDLVGPRV
jgi:hypothetical protein